MADELAKPTKINRTKPIEVEPFVGYGWMLYVHARLSLELCLRTIASNASKCTYGKCTGFLIFLNTDAVLNCSTRPFFVPGLIRAHKKVTCHRGNALACSSRGY